MFYPVNFLLSCFMAIFLVLVSGLSFSASNSLDLQDLRDEYLLNAKAGDAEAMYQLYRVYRYGFAAEIDTARAFNYLKRAAGKGHIKSLRSLTKAYALGVKYLEPSLAGVQFIDPDKSIAKKIESRLFKQVQNTPATSEDVEALLLLARAHEKGVEGELEADPLNAVEFYDRAFQVAKEKAKQGNATASWQLSKMYRNGNPAVDKDPLKRFEYIRLAADQGNRYAGLLLAEIYIGDRYEFEGIIEPDLPAAEQVLVGLVDRGDRGAMVSLATLYRKPEYGRVDLKKAHNLLSMSLKQRLNDMDLKSLAEVEIKLGLHQEALDRLMSSIDLQPHPNYGRLNSDIGTLLEILSIVDIEERFHEKVGLDDKYKPLYIWYRGEPPEVKRGYSEKLVEIMKRVALDGESIASGNWEREKVAMIYFKLSGVYQGEGGLSLKGRKLEPILFGVERDPKLERSFHERGVSIRNKN